MGEFNQQSDGQEPEGSEASEGPRVPTPPPLPVPPPLPGGQGLLTPPSPTNSPDLDYVYGAPLPSSQPSPPPLPSPAELSSRVASSTITPPPLPGLATLVAESPSAYAITSGSADEKIERAPDLEKPQSAEKHAARLTTLNANEPEELENRGAGTKRLLQSGRFQKYVEESSKSTANWLLLAGIIVSIALVPLGIYGSAKFYEFFPNNKLADEFIEKADDYVNNENYDDANDAYKRAISFAPKNAELYYRYGCALSKMGLASDAADELQKAVELEPKKKYMMAYASELMSLLDYEQAASVYERMLKLFANDSTASYWGAVCYEKIGKDERALELYKQSAKYGPEFENCFYDWSRLLRKHGKRDDALNVLRQSVAAHPNSAWLRFHLGSILCDLNKNEDAIKELQRAQDLDPSFADNVSDMLNELKKGKSVITYLIPLQSVDDRLYVPAMVNDKVRVKLFVDPDSQNCLLNNQTSDVLGLTLSDKDQDGNVAEDGTKYGVIKSLSVDKAKIQNVAIVVNQYGDSQNANGVLGMSFLKYFAFLVDSPHNLLELRVKSPEALAAEMKAVQEQKKLLEKQQKENGSAEDDTSGGDG